MATLNNLNIDIEFDDSFDIELPPEYDLILLNDDWTPANLVVQALCLIGLSPQEAFNHMLEAHQTGKSVLGTFAKSECDQKKKRAEDYCHSCGAEDFHMTVEEH